MNTLRGYNSQQQNGNYTVRTYILVQHAVLNLKQYFLD